MKKLILGLGSLTIAAIAAVGCGSGTSAAPTDYQSTFSTIFNTNVTPVDCLTMDGMAKSIRKVTWPTEDGVSADVHMVAYDYEMCDLRQSGVDAGNALNDLATYQMTH